MRLIDADRLFDRAVDLFDEGEMREFVPLGDIAFAPSIDPVEHGKWIKKWSPWSRMGCITYCSCCSDEHEDGTEHNYCQNCGAKMDLKDGGTNGH